MYFKLDVRIRNYSKPNYPFLLFPLYFPLLFYFNIFLSTNELTKLKVNEH